jgi:hypothetical protein
MPLHFFLRILFRLPADSLTIAEVEAPPTEPRAGDSDIVYLVPSRRMCTTSASASTPAPLGASDSCIRDLLFDIALGMVEVDSAAFVKFALALALLAAYEMPWRRLCEWMDMSASWGGVGCKQPLERR